MTLNFPDSPFNGEKFLAQNGIEYTYNIATDTWTGALSAQNAPIDPEPGDISVTPAFGDVAPGTNPGSGTQADPYNITNAICPTLNGALTSEQTITITRGKAGDQVVFTNNTSPADISPKFTQPLGYVDANGKWTGNIVYNDSFGADTTENTTYTGNLQVGATTVFFRWQVQQQATPAMIITVGAALNGSPAVGETISCTQPAVSGGLPTYTYTYKWQVSSDNQTFSDLAGETSQDLSLSNIYTGLYVRCVATVTDSSTLQAVTLDSITPSVNVVEITVSLSTLDPRVDEPITATATVSGGVDPVTLSYQWNADLVNIIGATSATYVVEQATADKRLRCQVTSTDGDSTNASVLSSPTNPVSAGLAPEINTVTLAEVTPNTPDRYTNQSFTTTVDMTTNNPESTFSLRGKVLGELYADTDTSIITATSVSGSIDGSWNTSSATGDKNWYAVTYGDGKFVAVGATAPNNIMYSSNGEQWTTSTSVPSKVYRGVGYGGGNFVAVSDGPSDGSDRIAYSSDGNTWNLSNSSVSSFCTGVAYNGSRFVVCAYGGSPRLIYSDDNGETWSSGNGDTGTNDLSLYGVTWGGDKFVAVGTNDSGASNIRYSSDGITWSEATTEGNISWYSVAYGDGKFVAVAESAPTGKEVAVSTDGINWILYPGTGGTFRSIVYGDGRFVASGSDNLMYSSDGITWESGTIPDGDWWGSAYGGGRFVLVDFFSTSVLWSVTGTGGPVNQTKLTFADTTNLSSISNGTAVVQNSGGTPVTSTITNVVNETRSDTDYTSNTTITGTTYGGTVATFYNGSGVWTSSGLKLSLNNDGLNFATPYPATKSIRLKVSGGPDASTGDLSHTFVNGVDCGETTRKGGTSAEYDIPWNDVSEYFTFPVDVSSIRVQGGEGGDTSIWAAIEIDGVMLTQGEPYFDLSLIHISEPTRPY